MPGPVIATPELIAERKRLGLDKRDEMWEGVMHVVPSPTTGHQRIGTRLIRLLGPVVDRTDLELFFEVDVRDAPDDYRCPDLVIAPPEAVGEKIEGAPAFLVEIRSPGDDSYRKIPYYGKVGTRELLIVDRDTRRAELFALRSDVLEPVVPDADGWLRSSVLGVAFRTAPGDRLEVGIDGTCTLVP